MSNLYFILLGFLVAQVLVISVKFLHRSRGYIWRAILWIWPFLLVVSIVELVVAESLFEMVSNIYKITNPIKPEVLAALIGILVPLFPNAIEQLVLHTNPSEKRVTSTLVKMLRRLRLDIMHSFAKAIRTRMEQDVYDCQAGKGVGLRVTAGVMARRIRLLYAWHKVEIAKRH